MTKKKLKQKSIHILFKSFIMLFVDDYITQVVGLFIPGFTARDRQILLLPAR